MLFLKDMARISYKMIVPLLVTLASCTLTKGQVRDDSDVCDGVKPRVHLPAGLQPSPSYEGGKVSFQNCGDVCFDRN